MASFFDRLFNRPPVLPSIVPRKRQMTLSRSGIPAVSINYAQTRGMFASPNQDLLNNLEKTRDLSRYLCKIDPFLGRYQEVISVFVVGQDGLKIEPSVIGAKGKLAERVNSTIKKEWNQWSQQATYDNKLTFNELEQLVIRSVARDGEALLRIVTGKTVNEYGIALQVLDPTLLDINYNTVVDDGVIIMGIEFDNRGRARAYHIWNRLPSDLSQLPRVRERISGDEILHIYDNDIPGAVRALPWTTPVLNTVSRLNQYLEVHLQACSVAATTPLVMTNDEPDPVGVDDVAVTGNGPMGPRHEINLSYTQILELEHGKSLQALQVPFPSTEFDTTVKQYLQSIAAGLFVGYSTLTADPAGGNSANIRFSSIVEREHFAQLQRWLIKNLHLPIYRKWIESSLLYGAFVLPTMNADDYLEVSFRNTRHSTIDPSKDMRGYIEGIRNGLYTRTQIVAEMGGDFAENIQKLAEEEEYIRKYKVSIDIGEAAPIPSPDDPVIPD
jgi:lambda family phage portal protein